MKRPNLEGLAEIFARNPDLQRRNSHIRVNGPLQAIRDVEIPEGYDAMVVRVKTPPTDTPKPSKYRNQPVEVDGVRFDSKKEAARWVELQYWERASFIRDLERQVPFVLEVNGTRIGKYIADFRYLDIATGQVVVEDVKSEATRKLPVYRMKKKLMFAIHQVVIRET